MSKQTYWLARGDEPAAQVEGAAERDQWVKVHEYAEIGEPADERQVYVINETTGGRGALPYGAVRSGGWAGLGWRLAPPPEPVDLTRDPALVDQPPVQPVAEPVKPKTETAASAASKKEN